MSYVNRIAPVSALRAIVLSVAIAAVALAGSATAANAAPISLDWTQIKVYDGGAPADTCRTWLGYLARTGSPGAPNGTAVGSDGATPLTVDGSSPAGCDVSYTWSFDASAGSVDAATQVGSLDFDGTLTYASGAHQINIVISDPTIELNGDGTGALKASGSYQVPATPPASPTVVPYTDAKIFDLDFANTACKVNWDGSTTLTNIAPSLAMAGLFGAYTVGSGPNRTPNIFGTFSLDGFPCAIKGAQGGTGVQGPVGPIGPAGPAGPAGKDGKDASSKTFVVKKSVFKTKKTVVAKVTKKGKFVGYAQVKGKKVKLTYITDSIKGWYKLTPVVKTNQVRTTSVKLG